MKVEKLLAGLDQLGWETTLCPRSLENIASLSLRGDSFCLAAIACDMLLEYQPITLRGLFYRLVSAGVFPDTSDRYYAKTGNLLCRLRREGIVSYSWMVDNIRSTIKPSSWSGLDDFAESVRDSYRLDFWSKQPSYVHIFVEKDAMSGVVEPVTDELNVSLSPVRGYVSDSYAHEIASTFERIDKPIYCYFLGDYDPSGMDLERSLREKIERLSGRSIYWERLALIESDFDEHNLIELEVKRSDSRHRKFIDEYGERAAEVDALPPNIIRDRVREAITSHIKGDAWERLREVEESQTESLDELLAGLAQLSEGGER